MSELEDLKKENEELKNTLEQLSDVYFDEIKLTIVMRQYRARIQWKLMRSSGLFQEDTLKNMEKLFSDLEGVEKVLKGNWQKMECEAQADIEAGRVHKYDNAEDAIEALE